MAIEREGTKQYMSIQDLPEISDMRPGDRFLVQASTGTSLLDFNNLLIGLDNVTFKETIQGMNTFLDEYGDSVKNIGDGNLNVEGLQENNIIAAINQVNQNQLTTNNQVNQNTTDIDSNKKSITDLNEYVNGQLETVDNLSTTVANQAQTITNLNNLCNQLMTKVTELEARVTALEAKG